MWILILAGCVLRLLGDWQDGGYGRILDVVLAVLSSASLLVVLTGGLDVTADAEGLHRNRLYRGRRIPWTEVTEIRPAPAEPAHLVIRGENRRTLVEGRMPGADEVAQLHTWHRARLSENGASHPSPGQPM
ncbi:PH domain-containing protein [Serinicoccus kebangsaanensis]|uniref:PH domain-containing protein n=1 Tax=Serinicoccus kebangsaanensis TaxID=2602069 RepID=UPI00178C5CAE|nr:PH domain-containing protein [Serinicoccus kebangsaanensis]